MTDLPVYEPDECITCGAVYGHDPDCGGMARNEVARLRAELTRLRAERPTVPRVCQIPDCGCDGTWHA